MRSATRSCSTQCVGSSDRVNRPALSMSFTCLSCPPGSSTARADTLSAPICQAVLMLLALAATVLAVAAWVYLLAGHGGFWRTDQRLPPGTADPAVWPAVVVVIPARDEA